jgi:hypothetical protein
LRTFLGSRRDQLTGFTLTDTVAMRRMATGVVIALAAVNRPMVSDGTTLSIDPCALGARRRRPGDQRQLQQALGRQARRATG